MALARIITRSHACSRELALDLLARGYAVEIVSPEKIPDNIADLELRVDTAPGDQLIASVEAHNSKGSASLEFVHHLKAPMADFIRRHPEPESFPVSEEPVTLKAEPVLEEEVEMPEETPQPAADEPPSVLSPIVQSTLADPTVADPAVAEPTAAEPTVPEPALVQPPLAQSALVQPPPQRRVRPAGWFARAAISFASVVILALVLGFGVHRTGKASAQGSGVAPAETLAAASTTTFSPSAPDARKNPGQFSGPALPPAAKSETKRSPADDLIAPDTVTYLDGRAANQPAANLKPKKHHARRHPISHKQGGVIAANKTTYLNNNPPLKTAK